MSDPGRVLRRSIARVVSERWQLWERSRAYFARSIASVLASDARAIFATQHRELFLRAMKRALSERWRLWERSRACFARSVATVPCRRREACGFGSAVEYHTYQKVIIEWNLIITGTIHVPQMPLPPPKKASFRFVILSERIFFPCLNIPSSQRRWMESTGCW